MLFIIDRKRGNDPNYRNKRIKILKNAGSRSFRSNGHEIFRDRSPSDRDSEGRGRSGNFTVLPRVLYRSACGLRELTLAQRSRRAASHGNLPQSFRNCFLGNFNSRNPDLNNSLVIVVVSDLIEQSPNSTFGIF